MYGIEYAVFYYYIIESRDKRDYVFALYTN